MHNVNVNFSRTDVVGAQPLRVRRTTWPANAGIAGVSTDPFDWGVPQLSFSSLSSLRDVTPSQPHRLAAHARLRLDAPVDRSTRCASAATSASTTRAARPTRTPNGAFVFTGLYASGGDRGDAHGGGLDFADFLLGLPQQAIAPVRPGQRAKLRGKSLSLYLQDDWRKSAKLTLQPRRALRAALAVRRAGRPDGQPRRDAGLHRRRAGALRADRSVHRSSFPKALLDPDTNNVAPRVGFAWRIKPGTILRGGYGVSYNSGSYSTIARQLVGQPPFAVTNTSIGIVDAPLIFSDPFIAAQPDETTNNYGVDKTYASASCRRGTPTSRTTSGRSGTSAPATPKRAARASTSCARRTAARTACASKACSRSSGRRRKASSILHAGHVPRVSAGR